jgi:hypothetical protein
VIGGGVLEKVSRSQRTRKVKFGLGPYAKVLTEQPVTSHHNFLNGIPRDASV